jgi:hypothetical protein
MENFLDTGPGFCIMLKAGTSILSSAFDISALLALKVSKYFGGLDLLLTALFDVFAWAGFNLNWP